MRCKLRRSELIPFFEKQEACTVVIEACSAAHHWARLLGGLGHEVKLIAPEAAKPFVKKGKKNDAADAAAICAAASRPEAKFAARARTSRHPGHAFCPILLVKRRTMLATLRGLATEFGLTVPQGRRSRPAEDARGRGRDLPEASPAGVRALARALPHDR
jgi:error-prone DNA polymerase